MASTARRDGVVVSRMRRRVDPLEEVPYVP
jgi:hypothetical protein